MRIRIEMIPLNSVGCALNTLSGVVYPMYRDKTYDVDNGSHLDDCCDEWFDALSKEDKIEVENWL